MHTVILMTATLIVSYSSTLLAAEKFERASIVLERTIEDADAEIKIDVMTKASGLSSLRVAAPDGRIIVDFKAPSSALGIHHLVLESPEPKDDGRLRADFPEGVYTLTGTTTDGVTMQAEAFLKHEFPPAAKIVTPHAGSDDVPPTELRVTWSPMKDIQSITVLIEDEKSGREISAMLAGTATSFTFPAGALVSGRKYKLAVGSIGTTGNKTVTEIDFTTGKK